MKTIELFELVSVNEHTLIFKNSEENEVTIAVSEGLANQCLQELQEAKQEGEPLLMEKTELEKMRGNHDE